MTISPEERCLREMIARAGGFTPAEQGMEDFARGYAESAIISMGPALALQFQMGVTYANCVGLFIQAAFRGLCDIDEQLARDYLVAAAAAFAIGPRDGEKPSAAFLEASEAATKIGVTLSLLEVKQVRDHFGDDPETHDA